MPHVLAIAPDVSFGADTLSSPLRGLAPCMAKYPNSDSLVMNAFDPAGAQLAVFSDGNHHMALAECIETFVRRSPGLHDVFYTTTPPSVYLTLLKAGELSLGNLTLLRVHPNVVIGPSDVVGRLHAEGEAGRPVPFAGSRGNAFLVRGGESEGDQRCVRPAPRRRHPVHVESRHRGRELRSVSGYNPRDGAASEA